VSLATTFRFELAYQARRVWPWLVLVVLAGLSFLMTRDGSLAEALLDDFFVNSPFAIAKTTVVGGLGWLLMAAAVAGEAGARDVATGMHSLTWTTPVGKTAYLGGRFLAALVLNAVLLLAVQVGILLGVYVPGVESAVLGPFRPAAWLGAYLFLSLPTAFVATAIQFALATRSGRAMSAYLGSLFLLFMGFFVASILLFRRGLGALLDPIGIRFVVDEMSHDWTTWEKSWRLIQLEGVVLGNRLLWLGLAVAVLAATWARFRFAHRVERRGLRGWWRARRRRRWEAPVAAGAAVPTAPAADSTLGVPAVRRASGWRLHARQALAVAGRSYRALVTSWVGLGLLGFVPLLTVLVVIDQMYASGAPLLPTTGQVLQELTAPATSGLSRWVIVPLLTIFFAGELVWREREAGLGEITDAMPGSEWPPLLGKLLALGLVLASFLALLLAAGVAAQALLGHHHFELGLYLRVLLGIQLAEYLLFAVLALAVHAVVDRKYVGHLAAVLAYVFITLSPLFGVHHDLLIFGAGPWWTYTDMRGLAPYVAPWLGFKLYWAAWALLLTVVARLFWARGLESGLRARLRLALGRAGGRLTPATVRTAGIGAALVLALGGFVFYNTNVLNDYASPDELAERSAEYERRYGKHARIPQPSLANARLEVEIRPDRRELDVRGSYRLVNRTGAAIDGVHLSHALGVKTGDIDFDRPAVPELVDEELGYRIYALETPLPPGGSLRLGFRMRARPRGFREDGVDDAVTAKATFFSHDWLPAVGYQRSRELLTPGARREHGLPERPVIPSLDDPEAPHDRDGGVVLATVLGTAGDQIAVAPGELVRSWEEAGRRYFEYRTDGPIGSEWAFASARYAVEEARWKAPSGGEARDVTVRIHHHPEHPGHVERTFAGIRASLDDYTEQFGPYPYGHLTVVEIPGDGLGVHADPSMLTHGEGFTLLRPKDAPGSLDFPFAVVAHEMAHQWAVPAAFVEGAPVLSESLAWYQAFKVVEHTRDEGQLRRLLAFMRQPVPYKPIHRGEPLLRGLDPYLSYRKGPFALRALDEYLGGNRVNRAIERLLASHRPDDAPLATTRDLYRELERVTPERYRYLLHDLFEVNTVWELATERVTAEETGNGGWRVRLDVTARKVVHDERGEETEVPLDEEIPVGVFAADPGASGGGELARPLHLERHRVRSGEQTITITLPPGSARPDLAGIDPHHLLDWEEKEDDDNVEAVVIEK
jgi:ABC-2 type transport system permease protein